MRFTPSSLAGEGRDGGITACIFSLRFKINFAGSGPAAGYFSCFAKKSNQKKATPVRRSCGLPCAARHIGRLRNSSLSLHDKDSDSARRHPLMYLCCSAALRGKRKPDGLQLLAKNIDRVVLTKEDTTMWLTEISIWLPSSVQRAGRLFHSGFYDRCWYWLERWSL